MIAFADGLPLIRYDSGRVVAFERGWLRHGLLRAARAAGYPNWWLADHVTESVTTYLRLQFEENVLAAPRLDAAVRSVLQVIGYAEIAERFAPGPPPVRISLLELAREAGAGYELAFFHLLGQQVRALLEAGAAYFELRGLEACVKALRVRKSWGRDCHLLRAEIVSFVRAQVAADFSGRETIFSLA